LSPLGQRISNWLASGPGLIAGETLGALWTGAHYSSGLEHSVPLEDFKDALDRAGYRPQQRTKYVNGKPDGVLHVLALPERAAGF